MLTNITPLDRTPEFAIDVVSDRIFTHLRNLQAVP